MEGVQATRSSATSRTGVARIGSPSASCATGDGWVLLVAPLFIGATTRMWAGSARHFTLLREITIFVSRKAVDCCSAGALARKGSPCPPNGKSVRLVGPLSRGHHPTNDFRVGARTVAATLLTDLSRRFSCPLQSQTIFALLHRSSARCQNGRQIAARLQAIIQC